MQQPSLILSHTKSTVTWLPWAVNLFRGNEFFVPKAIWDVGYLETEFMWSGNCLWNSVWKRGYARTCGWLEGERQMPSYHVPLSAPKLHLAVSVPRGNTACDDSVVLVYWLHRDHMVRSCSTIIYNVHILYIWYFNQWKSVTKQIGRSEGEGTGTRHADLT
jgi:hypothetical protein